MLQQLPATVSSTICADERKSICFWLATVAKVKAEAYILSATVGSNPSLPPTSLT